MKIRRSLTGAVGVLLLEVLELLAALESSAVLLPCCRTKPYGTATGFKADRRRDQESWKVGSGKMPVKLACCQRSTEMQGTCRDAKLQP